MEKAVNEVILSMTGTRKDVAKRLVLGAVVGRNATEIAQEAEMDYETVLNNLDKAAQAKLIEVVKKLVGDHPVLLIIDDTHDHKLYARAMPVSRNGAQIFYCRAHKRFEPAIQLLVIGVKDLVNNQIYVSILEKSVWESHFSCKNDNICKIEPHQFYSNITAYIL
ncbi:Partial ORF in transposase ISC1217 [Saccharolobus solfataricus P2]|uniref:Partial ORF in transposase ISC1217 n=1 Tax=Saccharolobus solfataricus (strain ATCC 35092 / DSM 1617 / JCM 11322 / P2) TaxID=273057 RepID=Q97XK1_SACS2|nr:Partial ORF in transposase ISC1217 [Saccharolobus solfataricus P2]